MNFAIKFKQPLGSILTTISVFILFIIAGIIITSKYRGLLERFCVTPFELYYFVLAFMVFLNN